MQPATKNSTPPAAGHWPQAQLRTAIIAGAFCAIVAVLMLINHFQSRSFDPLTAVELKQLKASLVQNPADEGLKKQIRALDHQLRRHHSRHVLLAERGGWLLIVGASVFLFAVQSAFYRRKLPKTQKVERSHETEDHAAATARLGVAMLGVMLGAGAWALAAETTTLIPAQTAKAAAAAEPAAATEPPTPTTPFPTPEELKQNWPRFRGPGGSGISAYANVPTTWNAKTGENILWKVPVPIIGPNSPVLWGNRVFLAGATEKKREVYCYDAASGKLLWQKQVGDLPGTDPEAPSVMDEGGFAPSTVATDGRRVYAIFANADVAAFDYKGNRVWARNLGKFDDSYGHASSLETWRDKLLIQADQGTGKDGKSKILALETATGNTAWESAPRPVPGSWASPILINTGQRELFIVAAKPWVMAYDPATGKEIWRAEALSGEVTPSPIFGAGFVFTAIEGEKLAAIKPDGSGDVTKTHVAWSAEDGLPDVSSPLCDGQRVYLATSTGTITCFEATKGKKLWEKELDNISFKSSPALAGDKVYIFSDKSTCVVLQAGDTYKEVARAELGEEVLSSPAFADGRIYVRGKKSLFCIGSKPK
ncbi:MAG: PQQ-binding-like beta-propeller repeat protein [Verrucomicrobia bacterium]|nr:PQQ-binding-like beta-propeller repeat protein [Verrucomicrobiota bacterium]